MPTDLPGPRQIQYSVTFEDYRDGNLLWLRCRNNWRRLGLMFIIYVAVFYIISAGMSGALNSTMLTGLFGASVLTGFIAMILVVLLQRIVLGFQVRRIYPRIASGMESVVCTWTDTEFNETTNDGEMRRQWSDFSAWAETDDLLILVLYVNMFVPVPRRAVSQEQLEDIRACLAAAGISQKKPFPL